MRTAACLALLILCLPADGQADWQPAKGPLMTRWSADVKPDRVLPEYPRPQMVRKEWQNLNGLWDYAITPKASPAPQSFSGKILVPFPVESALSGVMKRVDADSRLWYRRTFTIPPEWKAKRILLHFGAVDWEATVRVNSKEVGTHRGGYDPFAIDITDALVKDRVDQELLVGVWDPTSSGPQPRGKQVNNPQGIYYTPITGIWQTVWLEPVPEASITGLKIVPDIDAGKVVITASVAGGAGKGAVTAEAYEDGKKLAGGTARPGSPITLTLAQPRPWTPETPFLYDLRVALQDGAETTDVIQSYFAMRKVDIGPDEKGVTRLRLNNKPYFMVGPLDQGFWPDGLYTAPTDAALRYDIDVTKKLGFNTARKHVKVEPARWYYWCDRLGLLVWQDMPSGDRSVAPGKGEIMRSPEAARQFELELKQMIDSLHNHPCIVMWVVFNEGWGQYDTVRLTEWTKKYDPTRLANCASGWNDMPAGDVHDIHVYPGPGSPKPEAKRAAVLGEFGGLGLGVDGHTWASKNWSYRGTASSDDLTRKYERLLRGVYRLKEDPGLSAAIYTQTTDVETEINGLLTYDRAVVKVDVERVAAANRGDFSRMPEWLTVVPTSQREGLKWRYTMTEPSENWFKPDFDAAAWKEGMGGFGTKMTPGSVVRTEWSGKEIWMRRTFDLPIERLGELYLLLHHDEDAEIYLNGMLAAKVTGYTTDYEEVSISEAARATLRPGKNTIAVHCKQTGGGQYIDVGIVEMKRPR